MPPTPSSAYIALLFSATDCYMHNSSGLWSPTTLKTIPLTSVKYGRFLIQVEQITAIGRYRSCSKAAILTDYDFRLHSTLKSQKDDGFAMWRSIANDLQLTTISAPLIHCRSQLNGAALLHTNTGSSLYAISLCPFRWSAYCSPNRTDLSEKEKSARYWNFAWFLVQCFELKSWFRKSAVQ
jgi:hypothetical protein